MAAWTLRQSEHQLMCYRRECILNNQSLSCWDMFSRKTQSAVYYKVNTIVTEGLVTIGTAIPTFISLIAMFMGPTWGPSGADRTQVGPMLTPWTSLSAMNHIFRHSTTTVEQSDGALMNFIPWPNHWCLSAITKLWSVSVHLCVVYVPK